MEGETNALAVRLRSQLERVKGERLENEQQWLRDLRQTKNRYEPTEESRFDRMRSRAFCGMTRTKVKAIDARLMDLLFPAGSESNWDIEPTPSPELEDPTLLGQLGQMLGRPLTEPEFTAARDALARNRARAMARTIRDQLSEVRYRKIMRDVVHSGDVFGTGILKGPLVNRRAKTTWVLGPAGWESQTVPVTLPYIEFTPVWEIYPDTGATAFTEATFVFQRRVMAKHSLVALANRDDFDGSATRQYVAAYPEGDHTTLWWENELKSLGCNTAALDGKNKRYEVIEYWGVINPSELDVLGFAATPELQDGVTELWGTVWFVGSTIIKAALQPIDGITLPYYAYYYDKDETSIFGRGVPYVIRDDQIGLNAAVRAMQDNASITAGPQFEANVDLLDVTEDPRDIRPFKVWLRGGVGAEATYDAVKVKTLPSNTTEFLSMANFFATNIHEATLPSYMHGEATSKGSVGRTVGGLSLLMTQAQFPLKDQLMSIDDDVLRPFINAMYAWNMQFNEDPTIKGDFSVVVKGTSSLVAREIRAQNLEAFATATNNPLDAPHINRNRLNQQRALVQELGDGIVYDEDTAAQNTMNQLLASQVSRDGTNPKATIDSSMPDVPGYGGNASPYQAIGPDGGGYQAGATDRAVG